MVKRGIGQALPVALGLALRTARAVQVEKTADGFAVTADRYRARVDARGAVQSLVIGGTEFLAPRTVYAWQAETVEWPGTACGQGQGGGWPLKLVPTRAVAAPAGDRLHAEGDRWSVEYRFLTNAIEFTVSDVTNVAPFAGYPNVLFCWSLATHLARACDPGNQGELGWPVERPFESGPLAVLDRNGAGLIGAPQCSLSTGHKAWPKMMLFAALQHSGRPLTHRLEIFAKADLAHALKLEVLSPNPDHFFVGTTEAVLPVRVEALYGHRLDGRLAFTGAPFVWGRPELRSELPLRLAPEAPAATLSLKIPTPQPGQYTGSVSVAADGRPFAAKRVGFMTAPERIPPAPVPADFDAFWDRTMAELEKIPLDLEMQPVPGMDTKDGEVFKVKYRSWGGRWAWAWLHAPRAETPVPGNVTCPPVSVYQPGPARPYLGGLNILAAVHGGDIAEKVPAVDFDYMNTGITNRETYMLRYSYCCLARCYDIVRRHPKCNGTVTVSGGSQGGGLSLVLAGLRPAESVTGSSIALCRIDWTILGYAKWGPQLPPGEDAQRIAGIVSYYDPARFAHRIRGGTVRLGFGLFDWCAPAEGILSAVNGLPRDVAREVYADPFGDHFNSELSRLWTRAAPIAIPRWQGTDAQD
jgi:cephalosporin-C deacetylase